jgi:hypothetical protein
VRPLGLHIEITDKGKDVTAIGTDFLPTKLSLCSLRPTDLSKLVVLTARDLRRLPFKCSELWLRIKAKLSTTSYDLIIL